MEKLIIIGTGPNAQNAYDFNQEYNLYEVIGFAVNQEYLMNQEFCGLPVYAIEKLENIIDKSSVKVFVALLWNHLNADRKKLYLQLKERGFQFANLISPRASIHGTIEGDNCWIHDFVVVQNDTVIKNDVVLMAMSLVEDHTVIEDHCFLGANSVIAGGSYIGKQTFVGINCTVFDDTRVGEKCILGACTAVKRNVPDYSEYKTSSDILIQNYDKDSIEEKLVFNKNCR